MFDQAGMLREIVKWIRIAQRPQLETVIDRGALCRDYRSERAGYLSLPREVLAARCPLFVR